MKRVFYGIQSFLDYMDEKFSSWEIWPMAIVSNNYPEDLQYDERSFLSMPVTFNYDYFDPSRTIECTFTPDDPEATLQALKQWDELVKSKQ
jgi:hypothetical protein